MTIRYTTGQWDQFKEIHRQWWAGELDRPLTPTVITHQDPGRPRPKTESLSQANCADLSVTPDEIIDRADWDLSRNEYIADSCPIFYMHHFGPGVLAAFIGCALDNRTGHVWFHPTRDWRIEDLHFEYDPNNAWFKRICDICAAGNKRWKGQVLIAMTDLGGVLDVISSFLPGEKLIYALIETPDEVDRLVREAHGVWHQYYQAINEILQPVNPGHTSWSGVYCETTAYMLQCDFAYMISPKMFKRFVLPELIDSCNRLSQSFYHLDGVGQLPHLDSLLAADALDGIQWIPGDGKPVCSDWLDVHQKIRRANKKNQILNGGFSGLQKVVNHIGDGKGIVLGYQNYPESKRAEANNWLKTFGSPLLDGK
ncbi:MAG: hypothetical protein ABIH86_03485 [Planctomycetota bacterium]